MAYQWPLRDFLEYGALPSAVPSARLHTRQIAWEWGLSALSENIELLVSELMTNGIAAARAMQPMPPVRLWLLSDNSQILILVWDANPNSPAPVQADEYAESGRGLLLVEALSQRWGSYPTPEMGGMVVWALCGGQAVLERGSSCLTILLRPAAPNVDRPHRPAYDPQP